MTAPQPLYGPVDLTTCDREPIHVPGSIQPHGVLLAVAPADKHRVVFASENLGAALGLDLPSLLGMPAETALGHDLAEAVLGAVAGVDSAEPARVRLTAPGGALDGAEVDVVAHRSGDELVLVEIEPVGRSARVSAVSYRAARAAMTRLTDTGSTYELCDQLAQEIQALTQFDRVMVYRFDAEWNGEVVAEVKRADLNSFLGLHYPAGDIPAQARALYALNWTRLIADIGYSPVPVVPEPHPSTGEPLDLSHSTLRSVSPIHVEYLTNMGVTASMSVSLISEGRLWGLVACHHYSGPHRPAYDARSASEFLGQVASRLLSDRQRSDERAQAMTAQSRLAQIAVALGRDDRDPAETLADNAEVLLDLVNATGVAIRTGNRLLTAGEVPADRVLDRIPVLLGRDDGTPGFTDHLASLVDDLGEHRGVAAGALAISLGVDSWIVWVRPELHRVVHWGGDPANKALAAAEGQEVRLSPRKSFDKWREIVRGRSQPWDQWQVDAALGLRDHVSGVAARRSREHIAVAESLQRALLLQSDPQVPGLDVVARYGPARGGQLGGDWWDVLRLDDGRSAFVVGDVAGHGVGAAAAMAQIRTALRAYLLEGHSPETTLNRLDRLIDALFDGDLATVVVAVLDPGTLRAVVASAGHPPPLVVRADAVHVAPVVPRPPLGVGVVVDGGSTEVDLSDGSVLLLYSDGLIERRDSSVDEGLASLRAAATTDSSSLDAWAELLLDAVPGEASDDTTLLAVRPSRTS